jgi:hypothetical protein
LAVLLKKLLKSGDGWRGWRWFDLFSELFAALILCEKVLGNARFWSKKGRFCGYK